MSFQRIRSVEVDEGFLGGLRLECSDHLTCVIGSKGSGKTTLLELLRYALDLAPGGEGEREQELLVRRNLAGGTVRVVLETAQGTSYTIERRARERPEVHNEEGLRLANPPEGVLGSAAHVYSQAEIRELATRPTDQLALLDRFAASEQAQTQEELALLQRELKVSAAQLVALAEEVGDLGESLERQIGALREEARALRRRQEASGQDLGQATRLKSLRETEARALRSCRGVLDGRQRDLEGLADELGAGLSGLLPPETLAGPNGAPLQALARELAAAAPEIRVGLRAAAGRASRAKEAVERVQAELAEAHAGQDQAFDAALQADATSKALARELLEVDRRLATLEERQREQAGKQEVFLARRQARHRLTRRLSELREAASAVRRRVVGELNEALAEAGIRFELREKGDTSLYLRRLSEAFRGSGQRGQAELARQLSERLSPRELTRLVSTRNLDELAAETRIDRDLAGWVIGHLRDTSALYEIETVELLDSPRIEFRDGERWKPSEELSTGQKFTAILPILLLQSEVPLICDEPESHLDQATLVEKVVRPIQQLCGRRQLIFATHNPNLIVLGDQGRTQVAVLESDGRRGRLLEAGDVDATKGSIEALLEGGAEAFRRRAERYGFEGA